MTGCREALLRGAGLVAGAAAGTVAWALWWRHKIGSPR